MTLLARRVAEKFGDLANRLRRDERGSTLAIMAASVIPVLGMVGGAVDLGRAYMADSRLQSAVDAAVLAGAQARQTDTTDTTNAATRAVIEKYLNANFTSTYMGFSRINPRPATITKTGNIYSIELSVRGNIPTTLLRILGINSLPIGATAKADAGDTPARATEVMLVLDNTGSMLANGGMVALRAASEELFNIVYGTSQTRSDIAFGVLPYNVIVNVGKLLPNSKVEQVPGFTDATGNYAWKGCVMADQTVKNLADNNSIEAGAWDIGKLLPGDASAIGMPLIQPSMYPPLQVSSFNAANNRYKLASGIATANNLANRPLMRSILVRRYGQNICVNASGATTYSTGGNGNGNGNGSNSTPVLCSDVGSKISLDRIVDSVTPANSYANWPAPAAYDYSRASRAVADVNNEAAAASPNYICPAPALKVDYGHTRTQLSDYIQLRNVPLNNIGTWHNQAMTWGYRLLARDDVFTRTRPAGKPVHKVLVFMTDGNFDSQDISSAKDSAYTGYASYADKRVTDTMTREAHVEQLDRRFKKTCAAAKADGIEIYTITFAIVPGANQAATRELFKSCATDRNTHYFETQNTADLKLAFQTIGAQVVDIHLAK